MPSSNSLAPKKLQLGAKSKSRVRAAAAVADRAPERLELVHAFRHDRRVIGIERATGVGATDRDRTSDPKGDPVRALQLHPYRRA